MNNLIAQEVNLGDIDGIGTIGNTGDAIETTTMRFVDIISTVIGLLTIIAGLWFLFQLILAGYRWISAGGEKQAVQEAQKRISNSLIGLIIVITAFTLTGLIGYILGLETIDIGGLILNNIHP